MSDRIFHVCTDCAGVLLKAGAVRSESVTELGQLACETHVTEPRPAATSAFEGTPAAIEKLFAPEAPTARVAGEGESDLRETSPGDLATSETSPPAGYVAGASGVLVPKEAPLPTTAGPVTMLAAEFYVAILRHEGPTALGDDLTIERSVSAAKKLLRETKGA